MSVVYIMWIGRYRLDLLMAMLNLMPHWKVEFYKEYDYRIVTPGLDTQETKDKAQSFYEDMGDIALEQK